MMNLDTNQTVGQIVRNNPNRARVFDQLRIDYCCGGKVPLKSACEKRGLDSAEVVRRLEECDSADIKDEFVDADAMTLSDLCSHIEETHHAYLKEELPRIDIMTEKVARVHGDRDHRLGKVREAFLALKAELDPHMMKEEKILFPIIRQLDTSGKGFDIHCGSVANPIRQMEVEHSHAGDALAAIHELTDGYLPPDWACNTYRAMLDSLRRLEANMHQHVHKENNVLFPRAIQKEYSLRAE